MSASGRDAPDGYGGERPAANFAELAQGLRDRGNDLQAVSHFVNRLVFRMFAQDVGLPPGDMFTKMLEQARSRPASFEPDNAIERSDVQQPVASVPVF